MLSWWKLWWLILLAFFIPIFAGIIPQINLGKSTIGGGYLREQLINIALPYLPDGIKEVLIDLFTNSMQGEFLAYGWVAVNLGLFLAWLTFGFLSLLMLISNWHKKESFKKEQQLLRK